MDYLVYAHLQLAQDKKAGAVIEEMNKVSGFTETFIAGPYALAASPARYAVERGDWKAAAELSVRPSPLPHVHAVTHFARALGAARSGNPEAAQDRHRQTDGASRQAERKGCLLVRTSSISSGRSRSAWVLYAEGKQDEALQGA